MVSSKVLKVVGGALSAGGIGWIGGSTYQKYLQESKQKKLFLQNKSIRVYLKMQQSRLQTQ